MILHPPGGVADGWMGVGVGMSVWGGVPCMYACTRTRTHARTHARTCMLNMLNMDASMLAAICNSIHVCVCVCVHVRACACVCVHTPPCPQIPPDTPPPTCPLPRAAGSPKHPISITLELIDCLKILYL